MFLRSSGGGFFSACGFAAVSADAFAAAGLCAPAGGGLCSLGGLAASEAAGDLFGSVCANKLPAASKPVQRRQIGLNIGEETVKRSACPMAMPSVAAVSDRRCVCANEVAFWHLSCMFHRMIALRFRPLCLAGALMLALACTSPAKSRVPKPTAPKPAAKPSPPPNQDWQVIKIGSRDYLSADNIGKFYGLLGNLDSTGKTIVLNNGRNPLQLKLDSREAIVNGVRNWLCFPVIGKDGKLLVSRIDLAKTIEPQLRPQMILGKTPVRTIVLDPGHGGFDKGALSTFGNEKEYALDVARQLRPLLQAKGFRVIMTRENDVFIP